MPDGEPEIQTARGLTMEKEQLDAAKLVMDQYPSAREMWVGASGVAMPVVFLHVYGWKSGICISDRLRYIEPEPSPHEAMDEYNVPFRRYFLGGRQRVVTDAELAT